MSKFHYPLVLNASNDYPHAPGGGAKVLGVKVGALGLAQHATNGKDVAQALAAHGAHDLERTHYSPPQVRQIMSTGSLQQQYNMLGSVDLSKSKFKNRDDIVAELRSIANSIEKGGGGSHVQDIRTRLRVVDFLVATHK